MDEGETHSTEEPERNPAAAAAFWMGVLVMFEAILFGAVLTDAFPLVGVGVLATLVLMAAAKTRSRATVVVTGVLLVSAVPFAFWLFLAWAFSGDHS